VAVVADSITQLVEVQADFAQQFIQQVAEERLNHA
jgi:hypothetical protein